MCSSDLQVAEPLTATDQEVATVGATLALLSAVGVVAATLLGWAVARAGLAPVARLASVAEEVTLTGDPGRRVEVRRRDELGRLATSFNSMLSALQRSLDAQRRLVSDASHELRTPLASLRLNAELLAAHPEMPAAERAEILDRVTGQAAELSRLVASVTDLARGEPLPKDRARVRLDAVTSEALDAAKFGPPEGPVRVRLADGALTVRDHGPGIDPDDLPFVFDRFYRALSSRGAPGAGLGLAVVREIALGHGGEVAAEPARGGGTLMRLTLPARAGSDAPHAPRLVGLQGVDAIGPGGLEEADEPGDQGVGGRGDAVPGGASRDGPVEVSDLGATEVHQVLQHQIGRASCRERV